MSDEEYALLLRAAAATFFLAFVLVQWLGFRELKRRGADADLAAGCAVRDHVLAALGRASLGGLAVTVPLMAAWGVLAFSRRQDRVFVGMELFLAFLVVAMGLTAVTMRLALGLAERYEGPPARRMLLWSRWGMLASGAAYGAAVGLFLPPNLGETLLAVFLIGAGLVALGLNGTARMTPETLVRLAGHLTKRR